MKNIPFLKRYSVYALETDHQEKKGRLSRKFSPNGETGAYDVVEREWLKDDEWIQFLVHY
jgi:hypothetical protein